MEFEEDVQDPDGGFYSDSASWASQQLVNSTSDLNDLVEDNKKNSWPKRRPIVMKQTSSSSSSEGTSCEVCKLQDADTCVVHWDGSHSTFCMDCAIQCYATAKSCPLCTKLIVYFYKCNNI